MSDPWQQWLNWKATHGGDAGAVSAPPPTPTGPRLLAPAPGPGTIHPQAEQMWQQWLGWGLPAAQPTAAPAAAVPAPPERRIDTETGINWLIEKAKLEQALPPTAPREQTWFQPRSGEPLSGAPLEEPARLSFLPPEEGKPAWAQAPVPETWGEFPAWWAERQAGHVLDWWESAQEEIWGEPPEEQLDPGKVAAEQWKEAWEPAVTAYEAYAALPEKTPIAYLKALSATTLGTAGGILGGVIGAPIAGIKALKDVEETPGAIKALSVGYTALDQAARGVTGAVAGGFELFDTALVEQGILGVGAEIVWPLLQGHEADFTPQEFEAGRNRYSRWWNSVSAYSGELWKARMKGVDWKTSLDRAATRAGEATEELRSLTLDAVRNGATREDIAADATLTKPLAELAGRVILDPLNLMAKPGKTARMRGVTKAQARLINFEDSAHYDEIMDLMKAEGANNAAGGLKGPIWKMLHPNRADNATLAGRWAEDSTLVLSQMFRQATDPGEVSAIVRSMINMGDEGTDAARAAQVHLKKFGRMSQSATGKQTTLLLREMATDPKTGKLSLKVVGDWFADAKSDKEILGRIFESYDGAVARVFPTGKLNRVRRAQNQYRKLLSQYMYMGWNPGYAFRNGASNAGLTAISGWGPLESADLINAHVERWGSEVYGLRKGFGGPGGEYLMEKLHSALETIDSSYEAVRFTDLPASVIEDLAQKGIKGAPAMKLSEVVETASGEKIIHQSLEYFWAKHWRPKVPDELRGLFDRRALQSFERILADCVNPTELENALAPAMMGRNLPDGIDISKLPSSLRDGVRRALLEAEDADDFVRRMGALGDDLDTHLVKVLKETPASLSKGDPIVEAGIIRDRKEIVEAIEDAEYGEKLHKQVDTFDAQLKADRSKNLASVELAARYDEAHPGEGVGRMLADHAKNSSMTAKRVDEARDLAWQMYRSLPPKRYAEADVIWSATTGGPFDDLGFFPYRNREWGKYWAELDEPVTALYRRRPPIVPQKPMVAPVEAAPVKLADEWQEVPQGAVVEPGGEYRMDMEAGKSYARRAPTEAVRPAARAAPREELAGAPQPIRVEAREEIPRVGEEVRGAVEGVAAPEIAPSDLDAPDFAVRHSEIAEEILADITPNRQVIARVSNTQARQTLDDLAAAAPGMQWVPPGDLSPEDYEKVAAWVKDDLIPKMHESKLLGNKVALAERDFVLFNYGDRRHFDAALAYIFPYHYWYTRAATNIPRMLAYNPGVMAAYLKYKDCVHQINQEAQGLPWWEEQVKVPGTPFYLNLEATLNPLYSMINDFHNPDRTKTWQGEMLENLGNVGPSVDVAFWGLYAAWREAEGKPEEALASVGYLGQPTKAFRYATGLLGAKGGKGITLEPWMWDDPLSFTGLDYYERNRVGYEFKRMENEGAITPEAIWDEGRAQQGAGWDEAVSRQVQERAVPMLTSWLLGVGFKARFPYEIQVQKALNAQYQFYAHAEKTYDMGTEDGVAAYKAAQKQLYEYYPFLGYVKLVRRGELERDSAYTWEVLGRIQPGSNAQQLKEAAGVHDETIGKFYESHGNFEGWSDTDRAHFMASIEALGNVLGIPDDKRQKEWDAATTLYRDLKGDLRSRFGEDIFDIQAAYWDTRDICGADAADAIKEANPQLEQMWTARNAAIVQSPALLAYWGSLDTLDRVADAVLASETETRWPNYQEISTLYFKTFRKDEWKAQKAYRKDYLKQNPWLKEAWDFRDKMKGFLASEVDAIAAEMLPPLGPVVRDDTDLNSVLVERLMKVIAAQFEGGRAIKGPRVGDLPLTWPKGTPTTPAEVTPLVEGAVEAATETEMVDTETESVVQYGGAKRNVRRAGGGYTRRAAPTTQFSWQYVKAQLGQSVFGLIQHFNTKKPLGGELLTRLKDMFGEQPLGFGDFASWLRFLRTLWTASIVSSGGRGVKGVAERPKSFYGGMGQPGAGRRFLPWG